MAFRPGQSNRCCQIFASLMITAAMELDSATKRTLIPGFSLQPLDPAIITLNSVYRQSGLDRYDQEPSLPVKRYFLDEPGSKKADCKKLKIS